VVNAGTLDLTPPQHGRSRGPPITSRLPTRYARAGGDSDSANGVAALFYARGHSDDPDCPVSINS
jgi:hypothetical protein